MNYPNRIIKEGEKDSAIVTAIQNRLQELGLGNLKGTGVFGPKTTSAVKQFQATHHDQHGNPLEMDGKLGSITWEALFGPNTVSTSAEAPSELLKHTISVAQSQIGTMEDPPGSNKGQKVNAYLASVNCPPGSFWCAAFVYWCFNDASTSLEQQNPVFKTGGCLMHWNSTKGKKITAKEAKSALDLIKPGQIFIIDHGNGFGHTGLIEKVNGGFISTIEGNSNPSGSSNGIGVFQLERKISKISKGFIDYS
jgi:hypothetical protein